MRNTRNFHIMSNCKDVILCKSLGGKNSSSVRYHDVFTAVGFNCKVLPSLSFSFVNRDILRACLFRIGFYSGLVLTSPRAVEAIHHAIQQESLSDYWKICPAYCIGPSTESTAKSLLKLGNCVGSHCGNAHELTKYITQVHRENKKPLLYPCSAIARDTIQLGLEREEIATEKIISYETQPSETLEEDLLNIVTGSKQIFVFFSPSIVEFILKIAKKHNFIDNIKAVAIGQITAEALSNSGIEIYALASKPEPESLLETVNDAQSKDNINN